MGKVGALKGGRWQSRGWRRSWDHSNITSLCLGLLCIVLVEAATPGDDFLNAREAKLVELAKAIQANDDRKCEFLSSCTEKNCSRNTCLPEQGDVSRYQCIPVTFNKYCNGCLDKYFDHTRSSVRTAGNTDFNSVLTTIETCAQRALDPVFQSLSMPGSPERMYWGAIVGSFRAFPGSDQDVNSPECLSRNKFDTRLRPWYRASIYVPKAVVILVDAGLSMIALLSSGLGKGTILGNAKLFAREFVKTLSPQDYVTIIMFDSSKATSLSSIMVQVQPYQNLSDTTYLPELDPLLQNLDKQRSEDQSGTGASDIAKGVNAALSEFATVDPDAAKIILVLTDGKFAGEGSNISLPVTNLTSSNVKMFIYKIRPSNDGALFLGNSSFANQLCSIGASFEVISSDLSNPLLALNSFFTFTAILHAAFTNSSVDYSIIYPGYDQILGNITTASIPVFSANKTLLGVIGMDITIENLGNLTSLVQAAIQDRSQHVFKSADFKLTSGGCSQIQSELVPATPCPGVAIPQQGGFCDRTDYTSTVQDLACCGRCAKPSVKVGVKPGVLAAAVVTPVVVLIIGLGCLLLWRGFPRWRGNNAVGGDDGQQNVPFGGQANEPPQLIGGQANEARQHGQLVHQNGSATHGSSELRS